jgi:pyridoxamine 5'-phosphate oxidase
MDLPLEQIRKDYAKLTLDVKTVDSSPVGQFEKWYVEARTSQLPEPDAMCLSTVSKDGHPSSRIVLLKGIESGCFLFYSNYQSQKGKDLDHTPFCALNFFWPELERQVRIEGMVSRISEEKSTAYFQSRPRPSQIGAWASPQSSVIADRSLLEARVRELEKRFEGHASLPKPKQWGGFQVDPHLVEFWQGRPGRLHDRLVYTRVDKGWKISRLAP